MRKNVRNVIIVTVCGIVLTSFGIALGTIITKIDQKHKEVQVVDATKVMQEIGVTDDTFTGGSITETFFNENRSEKQLRETLGEPDSINDGGIFYDNKVKFYGIPVTSLMLNKSGYAMIFHKACLTLVEEVIVVTANNSETLGNGKDVYFFDDGIIMSVGTQVDDYFFVTVMYTE